MLHTQLNEWNFQKILDNIRLKLGMTLHQLVMSYLQSPPSFFRSLRKAVMKMIASLNMAGEEMVKGKEEMHRILGLLDLHGKETEEIVHQYYLDQLRKQEKMVDAPYGQLTVCATVTEDNLLKVN